MDKKLEEIKQYVKENLKNDCSGHGWYHTERVWQMSRTIAEEEKDVDLFVLEASAFLHDLIDWKIENKKSSEDIKEYLRSLDIDEERVQEIIKIIKNISFKGANTESKMDSIEGKIVQDADRLDALGAIGIARCFAYGGKNGQKMYDPDILPKLHDSFEDYKESETTSLNHFYEKLLLLKDKMNTERGNEIAEERHECMIDFLNRFFEEIDGDK
ncbi:MAG: HD domain-containing protein [Thermoplasmata archaeon]